jgi:cyclopropane fatty-acyl-phospholipid synthase-like methyltransferase
VDAGTRSRAFEIGKRHYDLGNDLFEAMLDRRMTYSSAYWDGARDLDTAQEAKLDPVCSMVGLEPGMRVLDFVAHWDQLRSHYDERFYRMWRYYLLSCAGMFRARRTQLWQIVLSRDGGLGGYRPSARRPPT